ncbi:MAG: FAD-dependent oxidoreductase [Salegentibacter sp.]|uniref:Glycine/D-amino acid oxidase n=1 Tax=Salegentibacter flavus TaxID=287099 RepID=A0A1I4ZTE5_9FLAO|nr:MULTISPECIES: FAD-dependent oxidoreductase [Salegentibacter]MDR9456690.1 FAD-dependent oxidoreductase [Salegentibacter sp.]SFN53556.1 Glycine/D-amino acid oxidase [Salegentibacter flavus]
MVDYIVVGLGLSGISVCERLEENGLGYRVFEGGVQKASVVAAGLINPVILKRFTLAWKADEQLEIAIPFYKNIEEKLRVKLFYPNNIYRRFNSAEEQNNWFSAADKPGLSDFLNTELKPKLNSCIKSDYGFGEVLHTGTVNTELMISEYGIHLRKQDKISFENFDYDALKIEENHLEYKGLEAKKIIFCEGFGLINNPFFNYLPLTGNKGEYITIYSEELQMNEIVKSSVFIIPIGNNLYRVGATYNNQDKSPEPTTKAREELIRKLSAVISCKFDVVDQVAGIRPASKDRRPLAGQHPEYRNLYCCNGFGSRGMLISPMLSEEIIKLTETAEPLPLEVDLARFTKKHYSV